MALDPFDRQLSLPVSDRDRLQGSAAAPIVLVEYGNYQCHDCAVAYEVVQSLQAKLGNQLCFVFRHFPPKELLSQAHHAAEAAEAAATQGKFWEMHHCLLTHHQALGDGELVEYAIALGLNINQFLQEMTSDCHVARVQADIESGIQSGVIKTPTFFINGVRHRGDWSMEKLMEAIAPIFNQQD